MPFIEELYYGNIRPNDKGFVRGTQYEKAIKIFCNNEQKLSEELSGKELKLFNEFVNAGDEISAITSVENFKLGFKLGVQMMCDCLHENNIVFTDIT